MSFYDSKKVYFSKKLNKALDKILESRCTVVNAPFGFGKTRSVKGYLDKNNIEYAWIDCTNAKEVFWAKYSDAISLVDVEAGNKLKMLGFPEKDKKLVEFANIMKNVKCDKRIFIVLDNYEKLECELTDYLFLPDASYEKSPFSIILIIEGALKKDIMDAVFTESVYCIDGDEFILEPADIREYMRGYSISLGIEKSNTIYEMTKGWMLIIQACVKRYLKYKDFNVEQRVNKFVDTHIFQPLSSEVKILFVNLSVFDRFTYALAETISGGYEGTSKAINDFGFLQVNEKGYSFTFHPIFKEFLRRQFDVLTFEEKCRVKRIAADYYVTQGEFFFAIKLYFECKDLDKIFKLYPDFYNIYINVNNANKKFFLALADNFWFVKRKENHRFSLMLAFIMFLYNEKEAMQILCDQIEIDVKEDETLSERSRGHYLAELEYIRSYMDFNDYKKMHEHFVVARTYSKLPLTLIPNRFPYNFQIPSVLTLFYNEAGKMNEIADFMDKTISDYYLLTYGHGKGSASLFRAELCYLTGDLKETEIQCHHAIYQAESRNQFSIMIAAYMYLCKAALLAGNYDGYSTYREAMEAVYKDAVNDNMQYHIKMEIDIADAVISCMLGELDKFPGWLKESIIVERSGNLVTLCYVFNLHARYLYSIGEYDKIIGISSQMLGVADMYKSPLTKLKANIVIAAAYLARMDADNAVKYLKDAIMLAYEDDIIMPFVENYSIIGNLLDRYNTTNRDINAFIKKIKTKAKALNTSVNKCTKIVKNQNNHGLTPREAEIAKLASMRYSNKQIAGQLFIAESTVKSAMKIIFNKLGISSRQELEEVL